MATLASLRTSVRRAIDEEDTANTHFTNAEIDAYLNEAVLFLGSEMEWALQTVTADGVEGQALYSLPSDFISLVDVYYDQKKLTSLDREDLTAISGSWQEAENGTPRYAYKADNFVFGIWPPPNAEEAGDEKIQIQYIQVPATVAADTDVPDLHQSYHLCLPFYAASKCESKLGNDKKCELQLKQFELHRKMLMSRMQRFDAASMRWKWTGVL